MTATEQRRADRALAWETAEMLQDLADRIRSGKVPRWAVETVLPSLQMVRHVINTLDDRRHVANVTVLGPENVACDSCDKPSAHHKVPFACGVPAGDEIFCCACVGHKIEDCEEAA